MRIRAFIRLLLQQIPTIWHQSRLPFRVTLHSAFNREHEKDYLFEELVITLKRAERRYIAHLGGLARHGLYKGRKQRV